MWEVVSEEAGVHLDLGSGLVRFSAKQVTTESILPHLLLVVLIWQLCKVDVHIACSSSHAYPETVCCHLLHTMHRGAQTDMDETDRSQGSHGWRGELMATLVITVTWRSDFVEMFPCWARVIRCGQQELPIRTTLRGTSMAALRASCIAASLLRGKRHM